MTDAFQTPESPSQYWRSLGELENSEEFVKHLEAEFPDEASVPVEGMSRRRFLSLMAASAALVGMSGCRWPKEEIIPFGRRPESYQPGKVKRFATTFSVGEAIRPVLVTSFDGRPIKVEGNGGGTDAFSQAEILSLYDSDRSKQPRRKVGGYSRSASWGEFEQFIQSELARTNGEGLAILLPESMSVVEAQAVQRLQSRYPSAGVFRHEPISRANEHQGMRLVSGESGRPQMPPLERVRVFVDFESSFLTDDPEALTLARRFADSRDPHRADHGPPLRLYTFESGFSATGAMADHRIPVASKDIPAILVLLAAEIVKQDHGRRADSPYHAPLVESLDRMPLPRLSQGLTEHRELIQILAEDLLEDGTASVLWLGAHQPAEAHALCQLMQGYLAGVVQRSPVRAYGASLTELTKAMRAGDVSTLLVLSGNPVYDAAVDLGFAEALTQVEHSIYLGLYENETGVACSWHLPQAHRLEEWDLLKGDAIYTVQPLIEAFYAGRSRAELLSLLSDPIPLRGHALVRRAFLGEEWEQREGDPRWESTWRELLHDGHSKIAQLGEAIAEPASNGMGAALARIITASESPLGADHLELNFAADSKVYDGRFANNGWLQELPDAVTKLTWDNALLISPALADEKGVEHGDMVELKYRERTLEVPIYVQPGQAHYSMTLNLGYGRTAAGNVGNNVGFNAYLLRTSDALWGGAGATITPTGRSYTLACTQDHHAIDTRGYEERERRSHALIREGTYAEHHEHPNFAEHMGVHHPPLRSLWEERGYDDLKWGMSIDLNSCTGCNACVIACQAENNISVVGKDEVNRGREMQWLRIDRYFSGDPAAPAMANQPMACVHCEMAPCEQVCPVAATVHSSEGLNVMVYNRCVGTRYCSNNCPYKVRRFNYFDNQKGLSEVEELGMNPEVTMRSRGVMEKCTYCVQRIEHGRITAKNERRPIRDGEIVTACQQTCPTQAIVFGDLNDEHSKLRERVEDPRTYAVLAELNVKPRTTYMARLRNPNPRLVSASGDGDSHTAGTAGDGHAAGDAGDTQNRGTHH